jgi:uncharacterized protein YkuJ
MRFDYPAGDDAFEDARLDEVRARDEGYEITQSNHWSFFIAKEYDGVAHGIVPAVGDTVRMYGGFGRPVRGLFVNGRQIYYRTEQQEKERFARQLAEDEAKRQREFEATGRAILDAKYDALPPIFQARIDKFRHNNPDFRWKYEKYEMFCCEEAVKLARHLGSVEAMERYCGLAQSETFGTNRPQWDAEWEEKQAIDRAAGLADGHSGNTHGVAGMLALLYLKQPEGVERLHGALAPLVGSEEYGCIPRDTPGE